MQVFNYAAYARVFELGVSKPNMTKIARALFEPIFQLDGLVNHVGNIYTMNSKLAKSWYQQRSDIPENEVVSKETKKKTRFTESRLFIV
ncbi:hypothetical protein [Lactobacillus equicursoris]|uniref:hypothetical protein n=1 Tax=Lactobacillus equicursoris TaxID=420645 RepID=UPI00242BF58E|nr:hypothetical protein [Lactobacillus equicursoris]MDD6385772.1 hypothetical protein [Lactobacillus equicursoris]